MSVVLRVPFHANYAAIQALGLAVDPETSNIVYLPLGWTVQSDGNAEAKSGSQLLIFDFSKTHRATFCCESQKLLLADDLKEATSTHVQLTNVMRTLRRTEDVVSLLSVRLKRLRLKAGAKQVDHVDYLK